MRALARRAFVTGIALLGALAGESPAVEPGERIRAIEHSDLAGRNGRLDKIRGKGIVLITRDTECPVSQRYEKRVSDLAGRFGKQGFDFVLLDLTPHSEAEARRAAAAISGTR